MAERRETARSRQQVKDRRESVLRERLDLLRQGKVVDSGTYLRYQHRQKSELNKRPTETSLIKINRGLETGSVLPVNLGKDTSYCLMSSYMANVVWKVMDDENIE